jgi:hypothetical protein
MKKRYLLTLGATLGACLLVPTLTAQAGITGSPHDFSGESWNTSATDPNSVCGPCHQPHNASSAIVPLWGHDTSKGPWTMYGSMSNTTFKATQSATPTGASLACLSCHDGTVAVNQMAGGKILGSPAYYVTNSAKIGTDLTHSHPISFTYDSALLGKDKWLQDPSALVLQPDSGTFVAGTDMSIKGFLLGGGNQMQCSSCHDVHNQEGTPFSIASNPKLVKINGTKAGAGSLLCRSCHIK